MQDFLIKLFMSFNAFMIRNSNGRIGSKLGTQSVLLLETIGRKTGEPCVIPIAYFFYEAKYLIVESNWGKDKHADWYLNLLKNPQAKLTVNGKKIQATAHDTKGEEYSRLWEFATQRHPLYLNYQKMTSRRIPIVVFESISK